MKKLNEWIINHVARVIKAKPRSATGSIIHKAAIYYDVDQTELARALSARGNAKKAANRRKQEEQQNLDIS
jgi:hypothetical protein